MLQCKADFWFHARAAEQVLASQGGPTIKDGQVILVDGSVHDALHLSFRSVIFVMDKLLYCLSGIVAPGLNAAYAAKPESVSLPLIRSKVIIIAAHFAIEDLIGEIAKGIRAVIEAYPEQSMSAGNATFPMH